MAKLKSSIVVGCEACGHETTFEGEEFDLQAVDSSDEPMGGATIHSAQREFECDECGAEIDFTIDVHEYPRNALNSVELESSSCSLVTKEDKINVVFEDVDENDDEQ